MRTNRFVVGQLRSSRSILHGPSLWSNALVIVIALLSLAGCIEESSTIVTFDQTLESTTFQNRLLTPVALFRDGMVLDTLPARLARTYTIGRKGVVRHAWQVIPPRSRNGIAQGVAPYIDLGVQYNINGTYVIDNGSADRTIFTPRIINSTLYDLTIHVNYLEADAVRPDLVIPANTNTSLTHAPYYYWHSRSNVLLDAIGGLRQWYATRLDTSESRQLRLDDSFDLQGSGATVPLVIF